jgi:hypothetical protein
MFCASGPIRFVRGKEREITFPSIFFTFNLHHTFDCVDFAATYHRYQDIEARDVLVFTLKLAVIQFPA